MTLDNYCARLAGEIGRISFGDMTLDLRENSYHPVLSSYAMRLSDIDEKKKAAKYIMLSRDSYSRYGGFPIPQLSWMEGALYFKSRAEEEDIEPEVYGCVDYHDIDFYTNLFRPAGTDPDHDLPHRTETGDRTFVFAEDGMGRSTFLKQLCICYCLYDCGYPEIETMKEQYGLDRSYVPVLMSGPVGDIETHVRRILRDALFVEAAEKGIILLVDDLNRASLSGQDEFVSSLMRFLERYPDTAAVICCGEKGLSKTCYGLEFPRKIILPVISQETRRFVWNLGLSGPDAAKMWMYFDNIKTGPRRMIMDTVIKPHEITMLIRQVTEERSYLNAILGILLGRIMEHGYSEAEASDILRMLGFLTYRLMKDRKDTLDLEKDMDMYAEELGQHGYGTGIFGEGGPGEAGIWQESASLGRFYQGRRGGFGGVIWKMKQIDLLRFSGDSIRNNSVLRFSCRAYYDFLASYGNRIMIEEKLNSMRQ